MDSHLLSGLETLGVPKTLRDTLIPFRFNDWDDIEMIVKKNASKCAAIVIEPCRDFLPSKKYLKELRLIASKYNCVLIFDEITSGWRLGTSGSHKNFAYKDSIIL